MLHCNTVCGVSGLEWKEIGEEGYVALHYCVCAWWTVMEEDRGGGLHCTAMLSVVLEGEEGYIALQCCLWCWRERRATLHCNTVCGVGGRGGLHCTASLSVCLVDWNGGRGGLHCTASLSVCLVDWNGGREVGEEGYIALHHCLCAWWTGMEGEEGYIALHHCLCA